jgi:hypothetical protein
MDLLLQLGEREATTCQEAPIFDNYSDSDDHITPLLGGYQALVMKSNLVGELTRRQDTKPSESLDLSPPRYATELDELPFLEGRPFDSSDEERDLIKPKAENFLPERGIFMVRIAEIHTIDEEGSKHLQLDDHYINDDYISDTPGQDMDTMMKFDNPELPDHVHDNEDVMKMEDQDDVQKERRRFRNTKRAERRQHTLEQ